MCPMILSLDGEVVWSSIDNYSFLPDLTTIFLQALHLSFFIPAAHGFPFIVFFLAFGQTEFHLNVVVPKIELQGYESKAFLFGFADEAFDFPPVQEEFAGAGRVVGLLEGEGVGADMGIVKKNLAFLNTGKAVVNVGFAQADGFNFGAGEDDARFNNFIDKVIEVGFAILTDDFYGVVFHMIKAISFQRSAISEKIVTG
jgi:hypothetical protein